MPLPQSVIFFQPENDLPGLDALFEQPFFLGQDSKILGRFSGLRLDIIKIRF
jgi:hypothetical protein